MIEQLRAVGLAMGTRYAPHTFENEDGEPVTTQRYVGWTTDEAKADAARELGATITQYTSTDPQCIGWDVTVAVVIEP